MAKEASMKRRRAVGNAITYIVLVIISIIWLFPLFCIVVQSFRSYVTEFGGMVIHLQLRLLWQCCKHWLLFV